jgi:uncharacterized membrane protein required for colicin V production
MAAFKLSPAATRFIETAFNTDSPFTFIAGFLMTFFLTIIAIRLVGSAMEKALQSANVNVINRMAGGILSTSIFTLIYSLLLLFATQAHILSEKTSSESLTYTFLQKFPDKMKNVYDFIKPAFKDFWRESVKFMDKLEERSVQQSDSDPHIFDSPEEEEKEQ